MSERRWDPNPTRGKVSLLDYVKTILVILVEAPYVLVRVCLRRLTRGANLSFGTDYIRTLFRDVAGLIPTSFKRKVLTPRNLPGVLQSNRFKHLSGPLCEEVLEGDFAGFWICRGLKRSLQPHECDLVVLYAHGGAFVVGHPLLPAVSYLRIAEIAEANGFSVAIFSLNYSLTPEAKHPTQRNQMLAAYRYLLDQMKVDPSRIVIHGQSAGGYLAMSFLEALEVQQLPKPAAAWLFYPWLDLTNSLPSFERNKYNDTLSKESLDKSAAQYIGGDKSVIQDFVSVDGLAAILPKYTWVTIGTHDSFLDSNQAFVAAAREDGADIDIVTYEGGCHAWDATSDVTDTKRYIALQPGDDTGELMKGAEHMANGLIQIRKKLLN